MNTTEDRKLTTADFAAAADQRERAREHERQIREPSDARDEDAPVQVETRERGAPDADAAVHQQGERLAPLFLPQMAQAFKARWDEVQIGFVDDPAQAVRRADELVAEVMRNLAETFADERASAESRIDQGDTEQMRVALRRYRSFFQRLLSL